MESGFVLLEVKNSRDSEETPAAMEQVFAALGASHGRGGLLSRLLGHTHDAHYLSFETVSVNTGIHFFLAVPPNLQTYAESQLTAQYPKVTLTSVTDWVPHFLTLPHAIGQLVLSSAFYYPLKTHKDVRDLDLLASVLGQMAKLPMGEAAGIQIRVAPAGSSWQRHGAAIVARGIPDTSTVPPRMKSHPQARLIETKLAQVGFVASIRLLTVAPDETHARALMNAIAGAFGVFTLGEGNALVLSEPAFWQKGRLEKAKRKWTEVNLRRKYSAQRKFNYGTTYCPYTGVNTNLHRD